MITCIPGLLTDLPSKHSRVAKVRELWVGKHISKSYQPNPAAQTTLASGVTIKQISLEREIQTCFQLEMLYSRKASKCITSPLYYQQNDLLRCKIFMSGWWDAKEFVLIFFMCCLIWYDSLTNEILKSSSIFLYIPCKSTSQKPSADGTCHRTSACRNHLIPVLQMTLLTSRLCLFLNLMCQFLPSII